jgi:hypothetical protein
VRGLPRRHQARRWPIPHRRQRVSSRLLQILAYPAIGRRHEVIPPRSTGGRDGSCTLLVAFKLALQPDLIDTLSEGRGGRRRLLHPAL